MSEATQFAASSTKPTPCLPNLAAQWVSRTCRLQPAPGLMPISWSPIVDTPRQCQRRMQPPPHLDCSAPAMQLILNRVAS